ncbi:MAG: M48 family metallopeptidase [Elusimicrobia bacterium]|nr:M48 family metallopeptidase [Elusimicrobiota bacterium]
MNGYLVLILALIVFDYLSGLIADMLNLRNMDAELPGEFDGVYDRNRYKKSQEYLRERTVFSLIEDTAVKTAVIIFILAGGFNTVDMFARGFGFPSIPTGLIFAGVLMAALSALDLPFSVYSTFVIEEKFGFNKTSIGTFLADLLKSWLISAVLGGIVFSVIMWFFGSAGSMAWVYCWLFVVLFDIFVIYIAPAVILPLFNRFTPIEEGDLAKAINEYAAGQSFCISGIYRMDGSRRSAKANAFFTGFGRFRRIVLYDTLIQKHTIPELVSILAHETGHYKKKHMLKGLVLSAITAALALYILSLFIDNPGLFSAFKMKEISIYAGLFFFSFLFLPINIILSVAGKALSRKNEYEADLFAAATCGNPGTFIYSLKKLSADNLSNLTPHPLKVFLDYTHPPVLKRIARIRSL